MRSGEIVKAEIPHGRPSGMEGFVFNTRRPIFEDWRVRDALIHAFNFEFVNQTLNGGALPRRASYFANSALAMGTGPAEGRVRELLEPFADSLVPGALDAYALPVSDGSPRNRANMRVARRAARGGGLDGAGRRAEERGRASRSPSTILLQPGQSEAVANIFVDALRQLGIDARVQLVDAAQYNERRNDYDYDMIVNTWNMSLSPGNEQTLYWGSAGVTEPGTRNYMGMASPAAEAMIAEMLATRDPAEFEAAVQALDRVLTTGRYVIPFWFSDVSHHRPQGRPEAPGARCRSMATGSAGCRRSGGRRRSDRQPQRRAPGGDGARAPAGRRAEQEGRAATAAMKSRPRPIGFAAGRGGRPPRAARPP